MLFRSMMNINESKKRAIESIMSRMSIERKAAQVINIVLGWFGNDLDTQTLELIDRYQPGSGMGGGGRWSQTRKMMVRIQDVLEIPMAVTADFESGVNFTDGTPFPSAMGRAAIADIDEAVRLTTIAGRTAAAQGRAAGAHWALAPVVDINANFRNPITNIRSYGDDLNRINALSAAYIDGLQSGGMAATAKHFPGDGFSELDQHKLTTVNPLSRKDWFARSGAAFKHAIGAGVWTIMPGHIACPALSSLRNSRGRPIPATFNSELLIDVLRGELGFSGLIVSDAFDMGGCLEHVATIAEAGVKGLKAGIDILLMVRDLPGTVDAIVKAVESGDLPEARLNDAVYRTLALKARLGLLPGDGYRVPNESESIALYKPLLNESDAMAAAEQSVTLTHDVEGILPLDRSKVKRVLINVENDEQFWGEDGVKLFGNQLPSLSFADEMRRWGIAVDVVNDPGEGATAKGFRQYDAVFYLFNNGPQASRNSITPCRQALRDIDWRVINSDVPVVFVALRSPYLRFYLPGIPNLICTYENSHCQQIAAVNAIFGNKPFSGRLPVAMPSPE